jgi:hypothetical protein
MSVSLDRSEVRFEEFLKNYTGKLNSHDYMRASQREYYRRLLNGFCQNLLYTAVRNEFEEVFYLVALVYKLILNSPTHLHSLLLTAARRQPLSHLTLLSFDIFLQHYLHDPHFLQSAYRLFWNHHHFTHALHTAATHRLRFFEFYTSQDHKRPSHLTSTVHKYTHSLTHIESLYASLCAQTTSPVVSAHMMYLVFNQGVKKKYSDMVSIM